MDSRILFVTQEMSPFLGEDTYVRSLNLELPAYMHSKGMGTRSFVPKFQEINERRCNLHDVIRLSGINIIIRGYDHPLVVKVASLMRKKIQVYFTDNRDYFRYAKQEKGKVICDDNLNGERCIFFAQSVLETVKKLCWSPNIVHCSGWMTTLIPLYIKKAYNDIPFFKNSKVVVSIDNNTLTTPINTRFASDLIVDGVLNNDVRSIAGFELYYEELMRFAMDYSDAIIFAEPCNNSRLINYAETINKPILYGNDDYERYFQFYKGLL